MENYFLGLEAVHPSCLAKIITGDKLPKKAIIWEFTNEIKPIDLYCYLQAKYGNPNGLQNFLRNDSSDNLIHWEWSLAGEFGIVSIQGHNFRTEVHLIGEHEGKGLTLEDFIQQIKSDFKNYGKSMKSVRVELEKWTRFLNPYHRINSVITKNIKSLSALDVKIEEDRELVKFNEENLLKLDENWKYVRDKYDNAIGITFGLRSMLPVLAESFINLLIFVLAKPEMKKNERLFQNTIRQHIDIRVQSLHLNCMGFTRPIDYTDDVCKRFHTLMNERNDLLHGNVEVSKLKIGEVYFKGKVPVFVGYEDMWQSAMGISLNSVKYNTIFDDHAVVINFTEFILDHLSKDIKEQVQYIMANSELGYNPANGRLGSLFSDNIADFRVSVGEA
jgi:hypothetical protein